MLLIIAQQRLSTFKRIAIVLLFDYYLIYQALLFVCRYLGHTGKQLTVLIHFDNNLVQTARQAGRTQMRHKKGCKKTGLIF